MEKAVCVIVDLGCVQKQKRRQKWQKKNGCAHIRCNLFLAIFAKKTGLEMSFFSERWAQKSSKAPHIYIYIYIYCEVTNRAIFGGFLMVTNWAM